MTRFRLLDGALGVDLPDGRSLKADRHHTINVDDATATAIRGSSAMRRYDAIVEVRSGGSVLSSRDEYVHPCGFAPWPWQDACPRCGDQIVREVS